MFFRFKLDIKPLVNIVHPTYIKTNNWHQMLILQVIDGYMKDLVLEAKTL